MEKNQVETKALNRLIGKLHCCETKVGLKENPLLFYIQTFPLQLMENAVAAKGKSFRSLVSKEFSFKEQRKFL